MKKFIALILVAIMMFTIITGCSAKDSPKTSSTKDPSSSDELTTQNGDPVKITLLLVDSDTEWNYKDTPNFKKIQEILLEKFNVQYELETALSKEFDTTVTTRFASGEKLPDMIEHRFTPDKLLDVYKNGLIIALNDLIDKHAPNYKAIITKMPNYIIANGDREGTILRIPQQIQESIQHRMYPVLHIRNDWLKKVGIETVKTSDDLYKALKAFQDKDVNENGKPDEVLTSFGVNSLNQSISNAFGVKAMNSSSNSWYFDGTGKVYNTFLTPETKNYVSFMNKLYSENLLDNSFVNQTGEQFNEKLYNNKIAVRPGQWWTSVVSSLAVSDKGFEVEYIPLIPTLSDSNKPTLYLQDHGGYGGYMITKDCKDPKAAMQVINWGYSKEGLIQNYYGESTEEGGNYYKKAIPLEGLKLPDFQMEYTEKGQEAIAKEPLLWAKMGWNQRFTPFYFYETADAVAQEFYQAFGTEKCGLGADIQFNVNKLNAAEFTHGIPGINFVSPTIEQAETLQDHGDLWIYMDEQISKFITGVEPISNWDDFVAQCNKMGIANMTSIKQEQYDAYKKAVSKFK